MERQALSPRTTRNGVALTALSACMVVGLAACGSSTTPATSRTPANGSTTGPVVAAVSDARFGTILENDGRPLYTLVPSSTPCDAACTKIWPEFLLPKGATKATAGGGVSASNLGTMDRGGGVLQVTYAGQPLYFFSEDSAGQVKGNISDIWGKWSDVVIASPSGSAPVPGATPSSTASTAGSNSTGGGSTATTKPPTGTTSPPSSPTTKPPTGTTQPGAPTTQPPPTTTTTASGGGGGVGF